MPHEMFMKEDDWVLIHMPSGNVKLSKLMKNGTINMGKFGSFPVNKLVGCPYGHSYEVVGIEHIRPVLPSELEEVDETAANNREITNDGFAQKLSVEDIAKLKDDGLKGAVSSDAIIQAMVDNHAEFDKKTEYSKAKYIKKKKTKFSKIFTPVRPRIATICDYYFVKNPHKIREIRIDTLSQMLNLANIQAGGRYLVVDNTQGLIVSSLLERMGGNGLVLAIHEGDMPNLDIVKYMNFPDQIADCLQYLRWGAVPKEAESVLEHHTPKSMDADTLLHHQRRVAAHERRLHVQQLLWEGDFDGLLIASQFSHESILEVLTPFIGGSRPVVIYSQYRALLNESKESLRNSEDWINPSITESFLREYQVLPGRTHPTMQTSGSGGALLTATRVLGDTNITGIVRSSKNAWGKRVRL